MSAERIFWVFGRRGPAEPIEQVGVVKAASAEIAYVYARANYKERPWGDLCVAPRDGFYRPARSDEPAERALR